MPADRSKLRRRLRAPPPAGAALALGLALALTLLPQCRPDAQALPEHRLHKTILRIGVLSREAPQNLTLAGTDLRLLVDGTPVEKNSDGGSHLRSPGEVRVQARTGGGLQVRLNDEPWRNARRLVALSPELIRLRNPDAPERKRVYPGDLEISADAAQRKLHVIVRIEALQYARAAAASELGAELLRDLSGESQGAAGWRLELLRAMNAAVLSYALANRGRHAGAHFDLCDLTHCLHFPGLSAGAGDENVRAPANAPSQPPLLLLARSGAPLSAYFHSTCGGRLARPSSFWPRARAEDAYFRAGPDQLDDARTLCAASPHSRWNAALSREEFRRFADPREAPNRARPPGAADDDTSHWRLERTDQRVTRLRVPGAPDSTAIDSAEFLSAAGRARGWNFIKSNDFALSASGDTIQLRGRGLGHGIGLCQWGARELARRGKTAEEILAFYYPGAKLVRVRYVVP